MQITTEQKKNHHIRRPDWLLTPHKESRGYIDPQHLRELWFHTGTVCNLSCPFCLEGSKPGDNRLNKITFDDAQPFIDEAMSLGVEKFSFTGGEPFVIRDMFEILDYTLQFRPCLVLTNGTKPLISRIKEILPLKNKPNALNFRISIDYPDQTKHDAGRGEGNFDLSLQTLAELHKLGFNVSVARQRTKGEHELQVNQAYQKIFTQIGLPANTRIVSFPNFFTPGSVPHVPFITEQCMTTYQTQETRAKFMCHYSKMIIKKDGRMRVYACTLVDDDADYDLGGNLMDAMKARVMLKHHRCYSCFAQGASCSE